MEWGHVEDAVAAWDSAAGVATAACATWPTVPLLRQVREGKNIL